MSVVALSAAYGAGGSRIGPALAERLGVAFLDRAIPLAVAEQLEVQLDDAQAHDEDAANRSWLDRMLRGFIGTDVGVPAPIAVEPVTPDDFRRATEEVLLRQAATGEGVILGRGSVIVLRHDPSVLRVRLDGPVERRLQMAIELQGLDRETAERGLRQADRTHSLYARRFYGADVRDPALYHLMIDSTALGVDRVVDLLALAATAPH